MIDMENEQEAFRIFAVLTNWYTLMRLFTFKDINTLQI
jgi:hypothetical protein